MRAEGKKASGKSVVHRKAVWVLVMFLCKHWHSGALALEKRDPWEGLTESVASEQSPEGLKPHTAG